MKVLVAYATLPWILVAALGARRAVPGAGGRLLLLVALYCGIPAANEAHRAAIDVLKEEKAL
mgnify:CR=1 FL=1